MRMTVDLKPEQRRLDARGRYELVNDTGAPVAQLHVRLADPETELRYLGVPGTRVERDDRRFNYRILRFERPLAPGARVTMEFATRRWNRGFCRMAPSSTTAISRRSSA